MTRAQINNAMRKAGNTEDRQEQRNLTSILSFLSKGNNWHIETETIPKNLQDVAGIRFYKQKPPRIDVTCVINDEKIGFRMMGPPHEEKIRKVRDANQKVLLEGNDWKIIDLWYDRDTDVYQSHESEELRLEAIKKIHSLIE